MGSCRTVASWSALTAAQTRMGLWGKCLELFAMMTREGLRADESSMVSALSSAKNLGAYDLGRSVHCSLLRSFTGLNIVVQTSLIDMYISCGCLEKGIAVFEMMSEKNTWTYSVVISGLAMHGEGERALRVFSDMLHRGHEPDEAIYVGVLSACSHAGLLGYTPDASQVLLDVEEEEKRRMVAAQSQKLAIAFALLNTSQGSPIRIITNLRMGKDCHTYTALVSTIFEREIMVRDRNRFHCFRHGVCTCGDHW
ncbi:PPR repeat [Musa troglodytarum]|uniref:PPR repeat n=1 Tax=Musa troglodytarum TaxID=320322 RepID=A0A9E7H580_9LILI|nr:PPR repeat [Musa troglodytarum]